MPDLPDPDAPLTEAEMGGAVADGAPLAEELALDLGQLMEGAGTVGLAERNVFGERGVGRIAIIRPCVSRGKRIRNLPPIYTPQMLEAHAAVFTGWPMYMDHVPQRLAEMLEEAGRSMKELGGQILKSWWDGAFTHPDDGKYGYQRGAVLAEVWATPYIRQLVGNNPHLLHTSINAWPKSGRPGPAPWSPGTKGMVIEGIRSEPQGSVDFVPRGGAGGRLLAEDERLVVSVAESVYNSPRMPDTPDFTKMTPQQLREWAQQNAPHLAEAIAAPGSGTQTTPPPATPPATQPVPGTQPAAAALTEADVRRIIQSADAGTSKDALAEQIQEATDVALREAREQGSLADHAREIIRKAEGLSPGFKADLTERYSILPSGPTAALLVEEDDAGKDGAHRSKLQVLEAKVQADLDHVRNRIAEATGKPRVTGEGGGDAKEGGEGKAGALRERRARGESKTPLWRERFAEMGLVESEDHALTVFGGAPPPEKPKTTAGAEA